MKNEKFKPTKKTTAISTPKLLYKCVIFNVAEAAKPVNISSYPDISPGYQSKDKISQIRQESEGDEKRDDNTEP